jgi:hypothetical protein
VELAHERAGHAVAGQRQHHDHREHAGHERHEPDPLDRCLSAFVHVASVNGQMCQRYTSL